MRVSLCHVQTRMAHVAADAELEAPFTDELPSRQAQLAALTNAEEFDVLVVGGGATGAGCALDAVTRSKPAISRVSLLPGPECPLSPRTVCSVSL